MNQWINRSHPQMLYIATVLCYFQAIMGTLPLLGLRVGGLIANDPWIYLFILVGLAAGGVGIANDKKWGWYLGLSAAIVQIAMFFVIFHLEWLGSELIVGFIFDIALVGLLAHSQTREYVKIWFR